AGGVSCRSPGSRVADAAQERGGAAARRGRAQAAEPAGGGVIAVGRHLVVRVGEAGRLAGVVVGGLDWVAARAIGGGDGGDDDGTRRWGGRADLVDEGCVG